MPNLERLTIDRIEDGVATLENADGRTRTVPASALPPSAREGDTLLVHPDRPDGPFALAARVDATLEKAAAARVRLPKGPAGDIDL
jgi:hypothetical protein